jgi:hypothetical protein
MRSGGKMAKTTDWVWEMHRRFARYAIPFVFGPVGNPQRYRMATCFVADFSAIAFVVTAAHVLKEALACRTAADSGYQWGAGRVRLDTVSSGTTTDEDLDLATIRIDRRRLTLLERDYLIVRPESWPPPELRLEDGVLMFGYPKNLQRQVPAADEIDALSESRLALIERIETNSFMCLMQPAYTDRTGIPGEEIPATQEVGGLSGGPAFLVRNDDPIVTPRLCGVVSEGTNIADGIILLKVARLDNLRRDGTIVRSAS